jgi:hypothetical protein
MAHCYTNVGLNTRFIYLEGKYSQSIEKDNLISTSNVFREINEHINRTDVTTHPHSYDIT